MRGVPSNLNSGYGKNANPVVLTAGNQLRIFQVRLTNRSGSAIDLGILRRFGPDNAKLWSDATGVLSDVTRQIQAGTATQLFSTTNNDGFVVSSNEKFNLVGFIVSQAQTGAPVYTYKYWNGTSFVTLPTIAVPASYAASASTENLVVFLAPVDWVQGGTGFTGMDATKFNVLVQATTAPTQAVQATSFWVGQMIDFSPSVADKGTFEWKVADNQLPLCFEAQDGLMPYFGGTANTANMVSCQYLVQS